MSIGRLLDIVARLRAPGGCPWDREQTHATLRAGLIEEAYETVDAIDRHDDAHLREELGDLLLQVVMHSQIASEAGRFDFEKVCDEVAEKLVRRHPHVFGDSRLETTDAVLKQWDAIKHAEKGSPASILDHISPALPALMYAEKVQKRAARVGFDWPDVHGVVQKIREELGELESEIAQNRCEKVEEELGDLLFSIVNLTRKSRLDAELVLREATQKFERCFRKLENELRRSGKRFDELKLPELDALWNEVKAAE
jgi:MazG family protein